MWGWTETEFTLLCLGLVTIISTLLICLTFESSSEKQNEDTYSPESRQPVSRHDDSCIISGSQSLLPPAHCILASRHLPLDDEKSIVHRNPHICRDTSEVWCHESLKQRSIISGMSGATCCSGPDKTPTPVLWCSMLRLCFSTLLILSSLSLSFRISEHKQQIVLNLPKNTFTRNMKLTN